MTIKCHCSSCGADFEVGEEFAGRRGHCPMCAAPVAIGAATKPKEGLPTAKPLKPAPGKAPPARAAKVPPAPAPKPPVAPGREAGGELPHITIDTSGSRSPAVADSSGTASNKQTSNPAAKRNVLIAAGAAVAGLVAVVLVVVLWPRGNEPASSQRKPVAERTESSEQETTPTVPESPAGQAATLALDDPATADEDLSLLVDGNDAEGAESGEPRYTVKPGLRTIQLLRRGYAPIEFRRSFQPGEEFVYEPKWEAVAEAPQAVWFDEWLQDFESARRIAAQEGKDILVLFDGSDWCSFCNRLASEVFFDPAFLERVAEDYVLVHVDFPRSSDAMSRVEDTRRNDELKKRFAVPGFPTVVVADEQGQPFGVQIGYLPGGVDRFVERLDEFQGTAEQLRTLAEKIETLDDPRLQLASAATAIQLLQRYNLEPFYERQIAQWKTLLTRTMQPQPAESQPEETSVAATPPPSEPPAAPEEPVDPKDPEELLESRGLQPLSGYFSLPQEAEFSKGVKQAEDLRIAAFKAEKDAKAAQSKVDEKSTLITNMLQQRRLLRAQLARTTSVDTHNQIVLSLNELADRIVLLEQSDAEEKALTKARGEANSAAEKYIEQLLTLRKQCDWLVEHYKSLAEDSRVAAAIEEINKEGSTQYQLGPGRYLASNERKLLKLEKGVLSDTIQIRRGDGDLWYTSVMLNGKNAVEMAIDTGASVIALPWATAVAADLEPGSDAPEVQMQMADGRVISGRKVIAESARVGKFVVDNVECVVMPPQAVAAQPLLGQSFLQNFTYKIDSGKGTLLMSQIEASE